MTIRAKLKKVVVVPMGNYEATLYSIDDGEDGQYGPTWIWTFNISSGKHEGTEIQGISSAKYSNYSSKSYKWATVLGHPKDLDFDSDIILGNHCRLKIDVVERDNGGERNNILDVLPPSQEQLKREKLRNELAE